MAPTCFYSSLSAKDDGMSQHDANDVATQWLINLETSKRTPEMWEGFRRWLGERPENIEAFLEVWNGWRALSYLWRISPAGQVVNASVLPQVDTEEVNNSLTS